MENNNCPNWLVPLEIARKLKEIGMNNSEIFVCNDGDYGWFRDGEIFYIERYGDTYTTYEASGWENSRVEPTYTWEQVFEWFREKGFRISLENHEDSTKFMFYNMKINEGRHFKEEFFSYEKAREVLVNKLIEVYENSI